MSGEVTKLHYAIQANVAWQSHHTSNCVERRLARLFFCSFEGPRQKCRIIHYIHCGSSDSSRVVEPICLTGHSALLGGRRYLPTAVTAMFGESSTVMCWRIFISRTQSEERHTSRLNQLANILTRPRRAVLERSDVRYAGTVGEVSTHALYIF